MSWNVSGLGLGRADKRYIVPEYCRTCFNGTLWYYMGP